LVEGVIAKGGGMNNISPELISNLDKYDSLNNNQFDNIIILLSGLGGALIGAVIGSILQYLFLKWNSSRKEHFSDIKKEIIELLNSISKTADLEFLTIDLPELFVYSESYVVELQSHSRMKFEIKKDLVFNL